MKTYWTYEVFSVEGAKRRSLVIAPCDDLAAALAGAFKDATYYIGVCGYKVALHFHELCRHLPGHRTQAAADETRDAHDEVPRVQGQSDHPGDNGDSLDSQRGGDPR